VYQREAVLSSEELFGWLIGSFFGAAFSAAASA
jgi:hypothetical protein